MSPFVKINKMFYIGKLPIKIPTASGDIRLSTERRKKKYLTIKLGILFFVAFYFLLYHELL